MHSMVKRVFRPPNINTEEKLVCTIAQISPELKNRFKIVIPVHSLLEYKKINKFNYGFYSFFT